MTDPRNGIAALVTLLLGICGAAGCSETPKAFPLCKEAARTLHSDIATIQRWEKAQALARTTDRRDLYLRLNAPPTVATQQVFLFCAGNDDTDSRDDTFSKASSDAYAWFHAEPAVPGAVAKLVAAYTLMHELMLAVISD